MTKLSNKILDFTVKLGSFLMSRRFGIVNAETLMVMNKPAGIVLLAR